MENEFANHPTLIDGKEKLSQLQQTAEHIKTQSEAFMEAAKKLSREGIKDAEKLVEFAKENWKTVLGATALLGISGAVLSSAATRSSIKKSAGKGVDKVSSFLTKTTKPIKAVLASPQSAGAKKSTLGKAKKTAQSLTKAIPAKASLVGKKAKAKKSPSRARASAH